MDAFRKRMLEASRDTRADGLKIKKKIAGMYERLAYELAEEAEFAKAGGLTEKFKDQLSNNMRKKVTELWREIEARTVSGMRASASRAVEAHAKAMASVKPEDLSLAWRINRVFSNVPDKAVKSVYNGSIYSGKSPTLSKRIWKNAAIQKGQIEQVIAEGVAKKLSAVQLADKLEAFVNPKAAMPTDWWDVYPNMPFCKAIDYNAKRLAVTSINHAHWQATIMSARENPYIDIFHWELTELHRIVDICDDWASHDEGLGEGNFKLDNAPCPHPWCTCRYYVDSSKSTGEIAKSIGDWLKEEEEKLEREAGLSVGEIVGWKSFEFIGKINSEIMDKAVKVFNNKAKGADVILTNERTTHIVEHRDEKYLEKFKKYFPQTIEKPSKIFDGGHGEIIFVNEFKKEEYLLLFLKLSEDDEKFNSILTSIKVGRKTMSRMNKKLEILYPKE